MSAQQKTHLTKKKAGNRQSLGGTQSMSNLEKDLKAKALESGVLKCGFLWMLPGASECTPSHPLCLNSSMGDALQRTWFTFSPSSHLSYFRQKVSFFFFSISFFYFFLIIDF